MITRFHVEDYKALRDVSLELTPIHVLIGPNDSGKTSLLNVMAAMCRSVDMPLEQAFGGGWEGRELVWHGSKSGVVQLSAEIASQERRLSYSLGCRFLNAGRGATVEQETIYDGNELSIGKQGSTYTKIFGVCVRNQDSHTNVQNSCNLIHRSLSGVHYFRWNPRTLAWPVAPDANRVFRLNSDGFGLALLLDDILGFDRERFSELEQRFRSIFPDIASVKLQRQKAFRARPDDDVQVSELEKADGKGVYFEVKGSDQLVPASQVSDGAMMVLGYLAILFTPRPPRLLLVDEPENGIHPKRLQDVLGILRDIVKSQSTTQVVLTTHSPYAVSLFEPTEVTLCTKRNGEVFLKRLSESKLVQEQRSVFTLGEIWTAEGDEDLAQDPALSRS